MALNNFQQLLKDQDMSQQDIADMLSISRPTVAKLLDDPSLLTVEQIKILSYQCNVSIAYLMGDEQLPLVEFEQQQQSESVIEERVNIPYDDKTKFTNAMLYILNKIGAKPNVGQTLLYKIFYFIDFDYYELYEEQLIGLTYIKNHYGPTPKYFKSYVDEMIKEHQIQLVKRTYFEKDQTTYLPLIEPDLSCFSANEIEHINSQIDRFKDMSAVEASNLSHLDVPWLGTTNSEAIPYEAVFYRTPQTSVLNCWRLKHSYK